MSASRRYEILLPLRFNDGQPVPDEFVADVMLELRQRFGAVSCETQTIHGLWSDEGQVFRDDLIRLFADVTDTPANREFFLQLKSRLKNRFQQLDIWLTSHAIEVH